MDFSNLFHRLQASVAPWVDSLSGRDGLGKIKKAVALSLMAYLASSTLYHAYLGPLSGLPGPKRAKFYRIRKCYLDSPFGTAYAHISKMHHQYGKVIRLGPRAISVTDKEYLKELFGHDALIKGPVFDNIRINGTMTMFNSRDPLFHKRRRRIISPAFSVKYLNSLECLMSQVIETFVKRVDADIQQTRESPDDYGTVDIWLLLKKLAFDTIGETAFGESFHTLENSDHIIPRVIDGTVKTGSFLRNDPPFAKTFIPFVLAFKKEGPLNINKFLKNVIRKRVEGGEKARRNDILQILIDAHSTEDPEDHLPEEAIVDETITFFVAGGDTTGNTCGFVIAELVKHPKALAKLRQEIDAIPMEEDQILYTHSQIKNLPYLNAVINEVLRLTYVGGAGLDRMTTRDITLGGQLFIPKGTLINCFLAHAHVDPDYWSDPLQFQPERWIRGDPTDAYMAFSTGPTRCIGQSFALQLVRLSIALLVKQYDFEAIPQEVEESKKIRQFFTTQIEKNSFKVKMKPRIVV